MKKIIKNKNWIVSEAHTFYNRHTFSLYITAGYRGVTADCCYSDKDATEYWFYVSDEDGNLIYEDDELLYDVVRIEAENDNDRKILRCTTFLRRSKNTMHYLFVPESIFEPCPICGGTGNRISECDARYGGEGDVCECRLKEDL